MQLYLALSACYVAAAALSIDHSLPSDQVILDDSTSNDKFLIELEPGVTRWITEDEKWQLRRVRWQI